MRATCSCIDQGWRTSKREQEIKDDKQKIARQHSAFEVHQQRIGGRQPDPEKPQKSIVLYYYFATKELIYQNKPDGHQIQV
jgi:hypothetical protein